MFSLAWPHWVLCTTWLGHVLIDLRMFPLTSSISNVYAFTSVTWLDPLHYVLKSYYLSSLGRLLRQTAYPICFHQCDPTRSFALRFEVIWLVKLRMFLWTNSISDGYAFTSVRPLHYVSKSYSSLSLGCFLRQTASDIWFHQRGSFIPRAITRASRKRWKFGGRAGQFLYLRG